MENKELKRRIKELEYLIANVMEESKLREDALQDRLNAEQIKCKKIQSDIKNAEDGRFVAINELNQIEICIKNSKKYLEQVEQSTHELCKVTSTDRKWVEAEVLKRAQAQHATDQK